MSRSHTNRLSIDAPPAAVWRALTEGEELTRWFAVAAAVEPGEGGSWKVSWDESPIAEYGRIDVWKPNEHLRLGHGHEREGERLAMHEDFELQALDGGERTRLTITASGFGDDPRWDRDFEGTNNGWCVFLRNLRFYLERHRDEPCVAAGIPIPKVALGKAEAFARVFGPEGVLRVDDQRFDEGAEVDVETPIGRLHGVIDFSPVPALLGLALDDFGLLRAEFIGREPPLFIHVMLLAYGPKAKDRIAAMHEPLAAALRTALTNS